jgi:prolyl-tRNA editing enzyme YbaK/EbsC (Cys-tRNA(Pro) deacylase)
MRRTQRDRSSRRPPDRRSTRKLRAFIDPDWLQHDELWAAAGTWHHVFALDPAALVRASGGVVTDLKH